MTTTTTLWIHDDGRLACPEHIGHYAQAVLGCRPTAQLVETPLGTWERLTKADRAQLAEMTGRTPMCETCEAKIRSRQHIQLVK